MTLYAKWVEALASIDRTVSGSTQTLYYESIAAAFSAANSGETVKVLKDQTMTESATVASGKTITLNVNLKTISCSSNINMFTVNGTLSTLNYGHSSGTSTISNTSGTIFYVSSTGSLSMGGYGDKITSSSGNVINSSGTVNIDNVNITSTSSSPAIANSGTLNIGGAEISASNSNNITSTSGTVNLNNVRSISNTIPFSSSSCTYALDISNSTLTVNSGSITSSDMGAIYVSNCTTTINGGNITADYRGIDKQNGGTLTVNTGATIICENSAYVANKFDWGSAAISSGNIWSDTSDSGNIYIKGGTIASLATSHTGICGILVCTSVTNLYIGVDDSSIDTSNPHIIGYTYAIWNRSSKSKIYWYDGLLGQSYGSSNSYVNTTTNFNYSSSLTTVKGSSVYTYNSTQYYGYGWSLKSRY